MTLTTDLTTPNVDPEISAAMVVYGRLSPLQDALGLKDLSEAEMHLFAMVAHRTGLDPFTKQIYAIKRSGKVTHQTGIDGYRSIAERTGEYAGSDETEFEPCTCGGKGFSDPPDPHDASPIDHPALARTVVHRILPNGHVVNQTGVARWHELKPDHVKPQGAWAFVDQMWWDMPYNQLSKCSEANGLRKAFPRVLGGVYIAEEMQQADVIEGESRPVAPTVRERIAARRLAAESPEQAADDTQEVKPAIVQASPAPVDSGSATAAACDGEDQQLGTGPCEQPVGHDGPHRNDGGVWPQAKRR